MRSIHLQIVDSSWASCKILISCRSDVITPEASPNDALVFGQMNQNVTARCPSVMTSVPCDVIVPGILLHQITPSHLPPAGMSRAPGNPTISSSLHFCYCIYSYIEMEYIFDPQYLWIIFVLKVHYFFHSYRTNLTMIVPWQNDL